MSFERPIGPGPEGPATPAPAAAPGASADGLTPAMRLQILSTEHWSLLASRALAWNESFTRAGMFLTTLSGAIVALALVAQASSFDESFRLFALVVLPVVLVVGIGTNLRMGMSNYHDAVCVTGMNRIRAEYIGMAPELEGAFIMGTTDDDRGVALTMAIPPRTPTIVMMLASTPLLVSIVNSILVGAIVAILAMQLGTDAGVAVLFAAAGFAVSLAAWSWYGAREIGMSRDAFARSAPANPPPPPLEG